MAGEVKEPLKLVPVGELEERRLKIHRSMMHAALLAFAVFAFAVIALATLALHWAPWDTCWFLAAIGIVLVLLSRAL